MYFTLQKAPLTQILAPSNEIRLREGLLPIKRKVLRQLQGKPVIQTNQLIELSSSVHHLSQNR